MTRYTDEQRQQIAKDTVGKTVQALEYDPEGDYYTLGFTDGTEFSFRFMADLVERASR